jgi:hypothetical protein
VLENRVLRRIFWPKRVEVISEWRKLHNEEFHDLYSSPNIVRVIKSRMRLVRHIARERGGVYREPEGNRPIGSPWRRWKDTMKKDLQEMGCGIMDWIELIQDRDR